VAAIVNQPALWDYFIYTAIIPLLFWFMDARWIYFTKGSILRTQKISEFINGPLLHQSMEQQRLIDFTVLDVMGKQYKGTDEYRSKTLWTQFILYPTFLLLYGGLMMISLIVGVAALLT
jgi:hypothetical protein